MASLSSPPAACQCAACPPAKPVGRAVAHAGRTARTLPSVLLSLGIAFFPKCPFCWAAYMSALGSIGLAKVPYLPWMMPVLLVLLAVHLLVLLRQFGQRRYAPFVCSVLGAGCILAGRAALPLAVWPLVAGIGLLVAGSLLHSFSFTTASFLKPRPTA